MTPLLKIALLLLPVVGIGLWIVAAVADGRCANSLICTLAFLPF